MPRHRSIFDNRQSSPAINAAHATAGSLHDAATILRSQRLRDLLASVEEFWRATGSDRTYWRRDARHRLAEWRRLHREPEMRAFRAAVARSQAARP